MHVAKQLESENLCSDHPSFESVIQRKDEVDRLVRRESFRRISVAETVSVLAGL